MISTMLSVRRNGRAIFIMNKMHFSTKSSLFLLAISFIFLFQPEHGAAQSSDFVCQTWNQNSSLEVPDHNPSIGSPVPLLEVESDLGLANPKDQPSVSKDGQPIGEPVGLDTTKKPWEYAGKLEIFRGPPNGPYTTVDYCSAQFIDDYLLLTAAHCIYDANESQPWPKWIMFWSALDGEGGKASLYGVTVAGLQSAFVNATQKIDAMPYDVAVLKVTQSWTHKGHFDIDSPPDNGKNVWAIGYPSSYGNGIELMGVVGPMSSTKVKNVYAMTSNPFVGGASGGAWVRHGKIRAITSATEPGYVFGVEAKGLDDLVSYVSNNCQQ